MKLEFSSITFITLLLATTVSVAEIAPGTLKWSMSVQAPIVGNPILGPNNTLYVSTSDNVSSARLWALDTTSGTKKWSFPFIVSSISSPQVNATTGNIIINANPNTMDIPGSLYSISSNGQLSWTLTFPLVTITDPLTKQQYSGPAWVGSSAIQLSSQYIYVPLLIKDSTRSIAVSVIAIYDSTGKFVSWPKASYLTTMEGSGPLNTIAARSICGPSVDDVSCKLLANNTGNFFAFYVFDGLRSIIAPNQTNINANFTLLSGNSDKSIWAYGNSLGFAEALNASGGQLWKMFLGGDLSSSNPIFDGTGKMYLASLTGFIYIINPDGTLQSDYFIGRSGINNQLALGTDGTLYATLNSGDLVAIDTSNGEIKWRRSLNATTAPVVTSDGTVLVGDNTGLISAFYGN